MALGGIVGFLDVISQPRPPACRDVQETVSFGLTAENETLSHPCNRIWRDFRKPLKQVYQVSICWLPI